jgi:hypothetical protein
MFGGIWVSLGETIIEDNGMMTNVIQLFGPDGSVAFTGHVVSHMPMMLDPSSMAELSSDFLTGLIVGSGLAAVLLGFRYVKKALGWVDGGAD